MDFTPFRAISFDCYGTLIDWETGLLAALRPILAAHGKQLPDARLIELYAGLERGLEAGAYLPYRQLLEEVVRGLGRSLAFTPSPAEARSLPESLPSWPPFPDTVAALRRLASRYRLAILSNIDDDLFAATARRLEVPFDRVVTAQQARSYKPSLGNFRLLLDRLALPPDQLLHAAESRFHDVAPARRLGLATVWVHRHPGAAASASGSGDAVPDLEVPDMKTLAALALAAAG